MKIHSAAGGVANSERSWAERLNPELLSQLGKREDQHKYDHGHALVLCGGSGHGGAARMAARAALRIGAGLVTLGCPPEAIVENAARLDAVMLRPLAEVGELDVLLTDTRINALCIGPGLGLSDRTRALVLAALRSRRSLVLDADALTAFESTPEDLFADLHEKAVLTPHQGEFRHLYPDLARILEESPDDLATRKRVVLEAAGRAGCPVLLKGHVTIIAEAGGAPRAVSLTGSMAAPWLATAGAGDVLSGLIAGLLARGVRPADAAEVAAWLHAAAARAYGPGLIAEDLPDMIPGVLRDLRI